MTHVTSHVAPKLSNHTANPRTAVLNQELKNWPEPCLAPSLRLLSLVTIMISLAVSSSCLILRHSPGSGVFPGRIYWGRVPPPASPLPGACKHTTLAMSIRRLHPVVCHLEFRPWVIVLAGSDLPRWFSLRCAVHLHSYSMGRVKSQPGCALPLLGL